MSMNIYNNKISICFTVIKTKTFKLLHTREQNTDIFQSFCNHLSIIQRKKIAFWKA